MGVNTEEETLLVEDDEDQVRLAMRALCRDGILDEVDAILAAGDGEEAHDYFFGEGKYPGRGDVVEGYRLGPTPTSPSPPTNFEDFFEAMRHLGWYWLNWKESP